MMLMPMLFLRRIQDRHHGTMTTVLRQGSRHRRFPRLVPVACQVFVALGLLLISLCQVHFFLLPSSLLYEESENQQARPHQLTQRNNLPEPGSVTIAYAISLIQCGDFQSSVAGMSDAAAVLRHSVHRNHLASLYNYKMYALVHSQAEACSQGLRDLGYTILVRDTPVQMHEIQSKTLRDILPRAWCCGASEYIKLYAYTLVEHEIVAHVDVDFLFTNNNMDDLFHAMLLSADSAEGQAARSRIPREWPDKPLPNIIEAFLTRDWPQVRPGRVPGFQAGFLVLRPSLALFEQLLETIRTTEYVSGYGRENGWGGKGYGAFVGSAAMQGLLAYFVDHVRPDTWVELNQCRFNHMGMDVYYRSQPNFQRRHKQVGFCRNNMGMACEDCQVTPLDKIYGVHYTQCRKPWNCIGEGIKGRNDKRGIPEDSVKLDHCMMLLREWNSVRTDLEQQLQVLTGDTSIAQGQAGSYMKDVFQGHCMDFGGENYLPLAGKNETRQRIPELYRKP